MLFFFKSINLLTKDLKPSYLCLYIYCNLILIHKFTISVTIKNVVKSPLNLNQHNWNDKMSPIKINTISFICLYGKPLIALKNVLYSLKFYAKFSKLIKHYYMPYYKIFKVANVQQKWTKTILGNKLYNKANVITYLENIWL